MRGRRTELGFLETASLGNGVIRKWSLHCAGKKLDNKDAVQPVDGFKEQ